MRKIHSFILMLSLCCGMAHAVDTKGTDAYQYLKIPYISVDAENNPVLLSASIFYPTKSYKDMTPETVKFVVLNNHPTVLTNAEAPTGSSPIDASVVTKHGVMSLMTTENALVISPDYLGYGYSEHYVHPFCNYMLTARNVIDGYIAALDTIKVRGVPMADDYYTISTGYSQGGAVTMGVQKYLETEADQSVNDIVRLKHSYCGAGPYDLPMTCKYLASCDTLSNAYAIPLTMWGLKAAYHEGCMSTVDMDSVYVSPEFRAGVERVIGSKEMTSTQVNDWITQYFNKEYVNAADMLRQDVLDGTNPFARAIDKALSKNNLLDGTWQPKTPITLFQYTGDKVVPYANSEEAVKVLGDKVTLCTENSGLKFTNESLEALLKTTMPDPKSHVDYGTVYVFYFLDGVLREK